MSLYLGFIFQKWNTLKFFRENLSEFRREIFSYFWNNIFLNPIKQSLSENEIFLSRIEEIVFKPEIELCQILEKKYSLFFLIPEEITFQMSEKSFKKSGKEIFLNSGDKSFLIPDEMFRIRNENAFKLQRENRSISGWKHFRYRSHMF